MSYLYLPQNLHWYGLFWLWTTWWALRVCGCVKVLPHTSHLNALVALWIKTCRIMLAFWLNALPHTLQVNGFCPEWVNWCALRWCSWKIHIKIMKDVILSSTQFMWKMKNLKKGLNSDLHYEIGNSIKLMSMKWKIKE